MHRPRAVTGKVTAAVAYAAQATAYARIVHTSYACNAICMVRVLVRFRITSEFFCLYNL